MSRRPRAGVRPRAALVLLAAAALLAGCATTPAPEPSTPAAPEPSASAAPAPEPTPTVDEPLADPTCDTIIPADVVQDFADAGWTAQPDVFRVGATEVAGGLQCVWGDYSVASDHVQIFGWAPIGADDALALGEDLIRDGWQRVGSEDGVYITEDPATAISTDDDGFGMTYFFGDGFVTVSDTKQGLLLISWPPAD